MQPRLHHPWDLEPAAARALQEELRARVVTEDRLPPIRRVAGVDISFDLGSPILYAAVVVLDAATLETVDVARAVAEVSFPYVPGLLSFREIPPLLEAFAALEVPPDVVVVDGHGTAHPRRFGIACHLGVIFDLPAVGCAKSLLAGRFEELGEARGSVAPLVHRGEVIGEAVRTRRRVQPVYVSPGHRISQRTATELVLRLAPKYRLPETTRAAHEEVNRMRRGEVGAASTS